MTLFRLKKIVGHLDYIAFKVVDTNGIQIRANITVRAQKNGDASTNTNNITGTSHLKNLKVTMPAISMSPIPITSSASLAPGVSSATFT